VQPAEDLLRFVRAPHGEVGFDVAGKMDGRGAWTCSRRACVEKAMDKGGFQRVFGETVVRPSANLSELVQGTMEKEVLAQIGLAFRSGRCRVGRTQVFGLLAEEEAHAVIVSADLAKRSLREVMQEIDGRDPKPRLVIGPSQSEIGKALGKPSTGVLALRSGPLTKRLTQNLRLLGQIAQWPEPSGLMNNLEQPLEEVRVGFKTP